MCYKVACEQELGHIQVTNSLTQVWKEMHFLSHTHILANSVHTLPHISRVTNKCFSHTREMLSCLKQLDGSEDQWRISDS